MKLRYFVVCLSLLCGCSEAAESPVLLTPVDGGSTPASLSGLNFNRIVGSGSTFCGVMSLSVDAAGPVYCWGDNSKGQVGNGGSATSYNTPQAVSGGNYFNRLIGFGSTFCGVVSFSVDAAGPVYCWGDNSSGQVGSGGTAASYNTPQAVSGGSSFNRLAGSGSTFCGVMSLSVNSAGPVYCWGDNSKGQVGSGGSATSYNTPQAVSGGNYFNRLIGFGSTFCGVKSFSVDSSGPVYCWGDNASGQVGSGGTATSYNTPQAVSGGNSFNRLAGSGSTFCGVMSLSVNSAGPVYCWGDNSKGQVGSGGSATSYNTPQAASGGNYFNRLIGFGSTFCGVKSFSVDSSGPVYCWGGNASGQVGSGGTAASYNTPQAVSGGSSFNRLAGSAATFCGVMSLSVNSAGPVYCWGDNSQGQVGSGGSATSYNTPQAVSGGNYFNRLIGFGSTFCGVKSFSVDSSGPVFCWGDNSSGQVGSGGTAASYNTPQGV